MNAMPQLARMTRGSATLLNLRCPYHATVIKTLEAISRRIGR
jgi:hypothetical protein